MMDYLGIGRHIGNGREIVVHQTCIKKHSVQFIVHVFKIVV